VRCNLNSIRFPTFIFDLLLCQTVALTKNITIVIVIIIIIIIISIVQIITVNTTTAIIMGIVIIVVFTVAFKDSSITTLCASVLRAAIPSNCGSTVV
jgi:hypothetical protein